MNLAFATVCFFGGTATALGPCAAPRMAAVVSLLKTPLRAFAFVGGLFLSYFILGVAAEGLHIATSLQNPDERILAAIFLAAGVIGLRPTQRCNHALGEKTNVGLPFATGLAMGCLAVPCCAPYFIFLLGTATSDIASLSLATAAFACGQLLPLLIIAAIGMSVRIRLFTKGAGEIVSVAGAVFSLMIGTYYAILGF